jgi:hypothetical protein
MVKNFNPSKDIPDLDGKIILVTGGTASPSTQNHSARKTDHTPQATPA